MYRAIEQLGGLETESQYPYSAKKSKCEFNSTLARVKVSGAVDLPQNETAMAQYLVQNGPLSIGMLFACLKIRNGLPAFSNVYEHSVSYFLDVILVPYYLLL